MRIYDTSSNGTSSTTTLRLKFSSNGHFIEMSLRRTQLYRMRHLVENFPLVSDAKINHGVDAILDTFVSCIVEIVGDNRSNSCNSIRLTSPLIEN